MGKSGIRIRPGTDADRPQILSRIREVFGAEPAQRGDRLWDWQWRGDPRLDVPGYRGIVAEWRGEIIANVTCLPAGLYVDGVPVQANWFVDVLVHWGMARRAIRENRRVGAEAGQDLKQGLAAAMFDHPEAARIQLGKHISRPMSAVLNKIGFEAMPNSGSMQRRVSLRRTLGRAIGEPLSIAVGSVANLALPRVSSTMLPVRRMEGDFGPRFDELWEKARESYIAVTRRDADTLNWRYRRHPFADYEVLMIGEGQRLRGYLVLLTYGRRGRSLAKIVDILTMPGDGDGLRALVAGGLRLLREQHVERVDVFSCGAEMTAVLRSVGFGERLGKSGRPGPLMVRRFPADRLYVGQGDGDGG